MGIPGDSEEYDVLSECYFRIIPLQKPVYHSGSHGMVIGIKGNLIEKFCKPDKYAILFGLL